MGRPAKALTIERWSVGSNPTLSAPTSRLGHRDRVRLVARGGRAPACRCREAAATITALSFDCGRVTPALRFGDGRARPCDLGWVARGLPTRPTCDTTTTDRSTSRPTRPPMPPLSSGARPVVGRLVHRATTSPSRVGRPARPARCRRSAPACGAGKRRRPASRPGSVTGSIDRTRSHGIVRSGAASERFRRRPRRRRCRHRPARPDAPRGHAG